MTSIFNRWGISSNISSHFRNQKFSLEIFSHQRFPRSSKLCRGWGLHQTCCSVFAALMFPVSEGLSYYPILSRGGVIRPFHLSLELHHSKSLVQDIRQAYEDEQTDGILKLATSMHNSRFNVDEIVSATLEAAEENKGEVASIMNTLIASCCQMENRKIASDRVRELLEAYERLRETRNIIPDIVTYSLAYKALSLDTTSANLAGFTLDQGLRQSKKLAGNKRRKTLAASRRKSVSTCSAAEDHLKALLGDDFRVLHETDEFVAISKPSGISCFHKRKTNAGKIKKGKRNSSVSDVSLEDALINCNIPLSTLNPESLGLVHRLDRGTSGCMVLAKTEEMHANLVAEFFLRRTKKRYLVIVAPAPDAALSEVDYIHLPVDKRPASSKYRIIERYGTTAALLEFDIYTGRKHQVRVHAARGLSSPVLMDSMYSSEDQNTVAVDGIAEIKSQRKFFLHAASLSIQEYGIDIKAPLPQWWESTISFLKEC